MTTAHLPPGAGQGTATQAIEPTHNSGRSRGPWRSRRRPLSSVPSVEAARTTRDLEGLWDRHGASVYTLAHALLGDETAAAQAMRLGMSDLDAAEVSGSTAESHRAWAHHVYVRSQELAAQPPSTAPTPAPQWLGHLAQVQRACVALCLFGGHTYREVASLLDLQPMTVAEMLTTGLGDGARRAAGGSASTA